MPRNEAMPLSHAAAMRAYNLRARLEKCQETGTPVTMTYVKRDASFSRSTGEVRYFSGRDGMDTMSVTLRTADKGDRTINLSRVVKAWPAKEVK